MQKTLSTLLIAVLLAGSVSLALPSTALAAPTALQTDGPYNRAYTAEQNWLSQQQIAMDKSDQIVAKVQTLIDRAKNQDLDVTALEQALDAYNADLAGAEAAHEEAAAILAAHDGFDNDGNLTDRDAARQTLVSARDALSEAHRTLTTARWDLSDAIWAWRQANWPTS